jgi:hypothetical protein
LLVFDSIFSAQIPPSAISSHGEILNYLNLIKVWHRATIHPPVAPFSAASKLVTAKQSSVLGGTMHHQARLIFASAVALMAVQTTQSAWPNNQAQPPVKVADKPANSPKPCAQNPSNRQFDFWLGEWDVVTADAAKPAGTSKIELILGDCVIQENWTSLGNAGYQGKSYNTYNSDLHRWEQFWNDNMGGMIHFYGGLKEGVMDYWTDEIPQQDGTKLKRHLQFIPSGKDKVRQFSQASTDGGKTWQVEYDFIYNRKK